MMKGFRVGDNVIARRCLFLGRRSHAPRRLGGTVRERHQGHDPEGLYVVVVPKSRWALNAACFHFIGEVTTTTWKGVQLIRDTLDLDKFEVRVFTSEQEVTIPRNFWGIRRVTRICWEPRDA